MSGPKIIPPLVACDRANKLLLAAGFNLVWVSMKSEACYFQLSGRLGTVRVASHGKKKLSKHHGYLGPVVASIRFCEGNGSVTSEKVEFNTAAAIGLYMIRATKIPPKGREGE